MDTGMALVVIASVFLTLFGCVALTGVAILAARKS